MFDYTIPDEIKSRIPEYFYYALGGEYVSIMGSDALIRDGDGLSPLDCDAGTAGYVKAFRMTCKKLDMNWLFEYCDDLPWDQSDIFMGSYQMKL